MLQRFGIAPTACLVSLKHGSRSLLVSLGDLRLCQEFVGIGRIDIIRIHMNDIVGLLDDPIVVARFGKRGKLLEMSRPGGEIRDRVTKLLIDCG